MRRLRISPDVVQYLPDIDAVRDERELFTCDIDVQHCQVIVNDTQPAAGLSTLNQEHTAILAALKIKKPTLNTQLSLL